jgi:hypothetical protein
MRVFVRRQPIELLVTLAVSLAVGCSNIEKAKPTPQASRADRPAIDLEVPQILRGSIASETIVLGYDTPGSRNYEPVIARGYGLVVGLNGTGSRDISPQLRAHMIAMASKGGMGSEKYGPLIASLKPEALLDSEDTAVVVVEAVVPQGAVEGTRFDVRVAAVPGSGTTSLEGGILYSALLRPGPLTTGGAQAFALAEAYGPVFVNPFAEPCAVDRDSVLRIVGRILNGGVVVKDMPLKLRLINPSHSRAAMLQTAINTRFPQEPGQETTTARGENDELIQITVPPSWSSRTDEFIEVLRHTTISQANPEAAAMFVRRTLQTNPLLMDSASWRWQALGPKALPIIRDLYDSPEELVRLAALRAGARLDDALVIPELEDMARNGSSELRLGAIELLAGMQVNPAIDQSLRTLLDESDVEIRLAAYEALAKRGDPHMQREIIDRKFVVDIINSDQPMIYITQTGQPRIVLFGDDLEIERPTLISAWSNRFMVKADASDQEVEVYFRAPTADQGLITRVDPELKDFIAFLGHTTTIEEPAPGLGMSYGETVGALHQIWRQRSIKADFKAEQDRILAAILRQKEAAPVVERPEFTESGLPDGDDTEPAISDLGKLELSGKVPTASPSSSESKSNASRPER